MKSCDGIQYMAKRYGNEEDIRQTVNMTFFQCIKRYERKDSAKGPIPFSRIPLQLFLLSFEKKCRHFLNRSIRKKKLFRFYQMSLLIKTNLIAKSGLRPIR